MNFFFEILFEMNKGKKGGIKIIISKKNNNNKKHCHNYVIRIREENKEPKISKEFRKLFIRVHLRSDWVP